MTRDPLLRDAVKAIKQKILTGAESASPEELAYLGTAIDRIGGRATVLEVEEIGDIKIAELTEHASQTEAVTMANIAATKMAAEGSIELTKDQAVANVTNAKDAAILAANQNRDEVIAQTNAHKETVINAAATFKALAIDEVAAAANSVTQQFIFGARSYFYAQL